MNVVGFHKDEILAVYQLLSAILNLGNAKMSEFTTSDGTEAVTVTNEHGRYWLGVELHYQY